jgi:tetratricopeptide (TPR) repeat protein
MAIFRIRTAALLLASALSLAAAQALAQSDVPLPGAGEGPPAEGGTGDGTADGSSPEEDLSAFGPDTQPAPQSRALPGAQSPEEEAQLRNARLDELFEQLAVSDENGWERIQNQIWLVWVESGSDSMDLLMARAVAAMQAENYELALRFLDDLVRLDPGFAEGWNKRATVYFLLEEYGRSVADIERTLALEPRHFGALSGLGMILERLGDKKGAMTAYRRGLELHPHLQGAAEAVERLAPDVDGRAL